MSRRTRWKPRSLAKKPTRAMDRAAWPSPVAGSSSLLSRRSEIDWLYRGVGMFFPAEWERFRDGVPAAEGTGSAPKGV